MEAIKERPILFSTPMVQAIGENRKTQTRRILKPELHNAIDNYLGGFPDTELSFDYLDNVKNDDGSIAPAGWYMWCTEYFDEGVCYLGDCPYGKIGDRLWVRETWWAGYVLNENDQIPEGAPLEYWYKADSNDARPGDMSDEYCFHLWGNDKNCWPKWKPSIHMPRVACRIILEITDIRIEQLQEITGNDALNEGIIDDQDSGYFFVGDISMCSSAKEAYAELWESINGPGSWEANPWVWVIEFKKVEL